MDIVIKCITEKYFDFSTRAPRKEFWLFLLCGTVVSLIMVAIDSAAGTYHLESGLGVFAGIFGLLTIIPYLAVTFRRLHDTNRTGWSLLLSLIPFVGIFWVLILFCLKGGDRENRFGVDPLTLDKNGAPTNM